MFLANLGGLKSTSENKLDPQHDLVTQSIDLINNYQFPIVIYNIKLNKQASKYFQVINPGTCNTIYIYHLKALIHYDYVCLLKIKDLKKSTILNGQQYQAIKLPSRAFDIVFNRSKYAEDVFNETCELKRDLVISARAPIGYCNIQTNFTNINLPLYVYDGLLAFVR